MSTLNQPRIVRAISTPDRKPWRVLVIFAVILALFGVAAASASPAHFHPGTATACDLCLSAHLLAGASVAHLEFLAAPRQYHLLDLAAAGASYNLLQYQATHTRGPPGATL